MAIVIGFWSNAVLADPIPEEVIGAAIDECQLDCKEADTGLPCEVFCSCIFTRFQAHFDYQAFLTFEQEMTSGTISDENQNFSAETGLVCEAEAEKAKKDQETQGQEKSS